MNKTLIFIFSYASVVGACGSDSRVREYLSPVRIIWQQDGEISGADNLLLPGNKAVRRTIKHLQIVSTDKLHPAILLDFGRSCRAAS